MKKRLSLLLGLASIIFVLVACGSNLPKAEDAVTAMINSEVYDKEDDKYEKYFHIELKDQDNAFGEIAKEFENYGIPEGKANELVDKLIEQIRNNTSFEVVDSEEEDGITTVTTNIYGIDMTKFERNIETIANTQTLKTLNDLGVKITSLDELDKVAEDLDDETYKKFADFFNKEENQMKLMSDVVLQAVSELTKSEKPTEYKIMLKVNPDNKDAWEIVNHKVTVEQLGNLLFSFE